MIVTIFFKRAAGQVDTLNYEIDLQEFKRLSMDYESFLKTGTPKEGCYKCSLIQDNGALEPSEMVLLNFDEVSVIG